MRNFWWSQGKVAPLPPPPPKKKNAAPWVVNQLITSFGSTSFPILYVPSDLFFNLNHKPSKLFISNFM